MTDRLGLLERSELTPAQTEVYDGLASYTEKKFKGAFKARDDQGRFVGPFGIILHTPELAKAYMQLTGSVAGIGGLDPEARETAILVVGATTGAKYETYAHEPVSGFKREELDSILAGKCPSTFEGKRLTAYKVAVALQEKGPLSKELWDEALETFGRDGAISLVHYVGLYRYVATLLNGFDASVPEPDPRKIPTAYPSNLSPVMLFPLVELALFVITLTNSVYAHQPSDWLATVETFSADFLYPGNGVIAASGKYPIFQSDVKGRVDVTTAFIGDELNVEYIFGLFAQVNETNAHLQDTFLLPVPISGKLQSLAIQDNIVSLSNIVDFTYFKQNITLPILLDAWFAFDRKTNQMQQYDVTFRRFAWFWKDVIPKLMPDLEKENHVRAGSMGQQELITLHAARHICSEHDKYCTDPANRQYDSTNDCLNFLVYNRTFGEPFELGPMSTVPTLASPMSHLLRSGLMSGGKMCLGRNYSQNVNQDMYEHTWIAPTSNSPESMEGISDHSMLELVNANMVVPHPFTMGWFPSVAMLYVGLSGDPDNGTVLTQADPPPLVLGDRLSTLSSSEPSVQTAILGTPANIGSL
ncbi:uncharacterized protein MKK02DRAFT_43420 [Dioszegia hungarica]|uniref:Carboxymuconolactone decarboxylase-like domain-containing protein n=1 Tax=Dioszegia hungarica TaxID=4972 RepID=A0AA38HEL6_9TREE|nr:uncharacterized protein MKK02DRAFT_43420 [Dioszegia hungarica]KAI9637494.1 hypothetical protein MKK02DRAFT_43420 [Dioszegia hungarica]